MVQNYMNFKRSHVPERMMQWSESRDGTWVEVSGEVLEASKSAFLNRRPMVEVEVDGNVYILDFFRMLKVDVNSGLQRSIAWIDVNGDCFFPNFFVDESLIDDHDDDDDNDEQEIPKIEIEIKIDADRSNENKENKDSYEKDILEGNRKRKVREGKLESEEEDSGDNSCNNNETGNLKRQCLVPVASPIPFTWPNARLLTDGERLFAVARDLFMTGMKRVDPGVRITSIHQFIHARPRLKARFEAFHIQTKGTEAARGRPNTVYAWHGASKKGVIEILAHGFGWPSKVSGPQAHGDGVYLSPVRMPNLSDMSSEVDDNGEKHVVLCRVILGNMEKVEAGSDQFHPSSLKFDSGTDDLVNPKWYVVWSSSMNTHILPECVVSYKCSQRQQGQQPKAAEIMNWIPNCMSSEVAKLFWKLGSSLPASKADELKALCITFKAGRMAKGLFIQQLKSVVGHEVLRTAISEIQ